MYFYDACLKVRSQLEVKTIGEVALHVMQEPTNITLMFQYVWSVSCLNEDRAKLSNDLYYIHHALRLALHFKIDPLIIGNGSDLA